jgi:succinate-acetate transporter protein
MASLLSDPRNIRPFVVGLMIVVILLRAFQRNPKDRVLLCEIIAYGSFIGVVVIGSHESLHWFTAFFFMLTILFTLLAGYLAFANWLHRSNRAN